MEEKLKFRILNSIETIYKSTKEKELKPSVLFKVKSELKEICRYFGCTENQAVFISVIFVNVCKEGIASNKDIHEHFNTSAIFLMKYSEDFDELVEKGIIKYSLHPKGRHKRAYVNEGVYIIPDKIIQAVLNSKTLPELKDGVCNTIFELFEKLNEFREEAENGEISGNELLRESQRYITAYKKFDFIKIILDFKLKPDDNYVLMYLVWNTINGSNALDVSSCVDLIYYSKSRRLDYAQQLFNENNKLLENDMIEIEEADYFDKTRIRLSEKTISFLQECGIKLYPKRRKNKNIITPDEVKTKKLIYNTKEAVEITMLSKFMTDCKFRNLQKHFESKSLIKGITALFYGVPGTGKTETVYQITRQTKRELMSIDMSQSKSMWFGESEKIIKQIFMDYKEYSKQCNRTPILLFNEADGIISKRKDVGSSSLAKTENTMQNIILEELEKFEGIFIATTNLLSNIDKAFERRFLFKIEFCHPDKTVSTKIWKLKFPALSINYCKQLAEEFNFSGAEIDNILRKTEMHSILHNKPVNYNQIIEFCKAEKWDEKISGKRIGFGR